jgi:hypothetical protein
MNKHTKTILIRIVHSYEPQTRSTDSDADSATRDETDTPTLIMYKNIGHWHQYIYDNLMNE